MSWLVAHPMVAVLVPLVLALAIPLGGRRTAVAAPWVAMLGPLLVTGLGIGSLVAVAGTRPVAEPWRSALASHGGHAWVGALRLGWAVDSLAAVMLLVVGVVALMVMLFSVGYMHGDRGFVRYFALLSLFTASMTLLVIADGFVALFVGWELVGACSYLLIGFWFEKPSARDAAMKAFVTTRVGDVGLMLGLAVLWTATGTLGYAAMFQRIAAVPATLVTLAAVLLACGAIGKSAQFPLHIWLPDAMEGPTPVSGLIHAATMVAAGVYLVVRVWPLFEMAPAARSLLLVVGLVSAVGAACAAVAQLDVKRVLAYSTISQLGFMFVALGVGAWEAAFFHLVAHAMFKALLFLASGSLIHGTDTQDLRQMGGLRAEMPVTFWTWLAGAFALVGVWPFAGFFSKDEILVAAWRSGPLVGVALLATVGLTALYVTRATRLAFFDAYRGRGHAHEGSLTMLVPLVALAVPSALLGLALGATGWFSRVLGEPSQSPAFTIAVASMACALTGVVLGWRVSGGATGDEAFELSLGGLWPVLRGAFGWDRLISVHLVKFVAAVVRVLWAFVDRLLVDGAVEGLGWLATATGRGLAALEDGNVQGYVALLASGAAVIVVAQWYPPALALGFGAVAVVAAFKAVRSR